LQGIKSKKHPAGNAKCFLNVISRYLIFLVYCYLHILLKMSANRLQIFVVGISVAVDPFSSFPMFIADLAQN